MAAYFALCSYARLGTWLVDSFSSIFGLGFGFLSAVHSNIPYRLHHCISPCMIYLWDASLTLVPYVL